jgi:hypothetical protein
MKLSKLIIAIILLGSIGCNNNKSENHGHKHGPEGEHFQETDEDLKQEVFVIQSDTLNTFKEKESKNLKNHSNEDDHTH